jgi:hypothetical protein
LLFAITVVPPPWITTMCPTQQAFGSGAKRRALMRDFEKYMLDDQAHEIFLLWRYRIVRSDAM